jgi:hypothetical protein
MSGEGEGQPRQSSRRGTFVQQFISLQVLLACYDNFFRKIDRNMETGPRYGIVCSDFVTTNREIPQIRLLNLVDWSMNILDYWD